MLQYLLNYPIREYAKSLFSPKTQGPDIGLYLGSEKQMLLVQGKKPGGIAAWEPSLKSYIGAPTLPSITKSEMDMGNPHVPSSFRKELGLPLRLQNNNRCQLLIEDPHIQIWQISPKTLDSGKGESKEFKTVQSLRQALEEDPSEHIPLWESYNNVGDYRWEILDLAWRTMGASEKPPQKVFAVGYPEEKIQGICRWARAFKIQILNLLPAQIAVNRLIRDFDAAGPDENKTKGTYFLLYVGEGETTLSFTMKGGVYLFSNSKGQDTLNIKETTMVIEEIQDQDGIPRETPIHIWGVPKDDYLMQSLKDRGWTNIRLWNEETLMGEDPILLESNPEQTHIQSPIPWLLRYCMR